MKAFSASHQSYLFSREPTEPTHHDHPVEHNSEDEIALTVDEIIDNAYAACIQAMKDKVKDDIFAGLSEQTNLDLLTGPTPVHSAGTPEVLHPEEDAG